MENQEILNEIEELKNQVTRLCLKIQSLEDEIDLQRGILAGNDIFI